MSSSSSSSSDDPNWDVEYYAYNDYLPNNANQVDKWTLEPGSGGTIVVEDDVNCNNGKRLRIDTPASASPVVAYFTHNGSSKWANNVSNADGYEIETRIKVVDSGANACQMIGVLDGTYCFYVQWKGNSIKVDAVYISEATQSYSVDLTDAYHVIDIVVVGTSLTVKVDGTTRITATLDYAFATKQLRFGDISVSDYYGGECYWDYIRYKCN